MGLEGSEWERVKLLFAFPVENGANLDGDMKNNNLMGSDKWKVTKFLSKSNL